MHMSKFYNYALTCEEVEPITEEKRNWVIWLQLLPCFIVPQINSFVHN